MPRRRFQLGKSRSSRVRREKRRSAYKAGAVLIVVATLVGILAWFSHDEKVVINSINISGNAVLSDKELLGVVEEEIRGNRLLWFSRKNVLLLPIRGIKAAVLDSFPRVKSIEVARDDLNALSITVEERKPSGLWCGERFVAQDASSGTCYFLDEQGFIFAKAPDFTGTVFFRYFGSVGEGTPIGAQLFTKEEFYNFTLLRAALDQIDLYPYALSVAQELDVELYLESGGKLLLSLNQDYTELLQNVETVFSSEVFQKRDISTLEYVDLRFGNKVYYKFEE